MCLRAYRKGLRNLYTPFTKLYHLESKSRDSYIPIIDFKMSQKYYKEFWIKGDPYYNKNLSLKSCTPTIKTEQEIIEEKKKVSKKANTKTTKSTKTTKTTAKATSSKKKTSSTKKAATTSTK